jgi:hypothetical protein
MIRLYIDQGLIPPNKRHCILLYPFLGNLDTDPASPDYGRFDVYCSCARKLFALTQHAGECDAFLMPFDYAFDADSHKVAHNLGRLAAQHGRKLIIFCNHDEDKAIDAPGAVIFRTSSRRGGRPGEHGFPAWSADMLPELAPGWEPQPLPSDPSVSYCGYLDYLEPEERFSRERLATLARQYLRGHFGSRYIRGPQLRGRALRALRRARIETHIVRRSGFWAPGMDPQTARAEFFANLMSSVYALVARGAGNFSYRLYEAMSCARVPLYIDSGGLLPFSRQLDWASLLVRVPERDIDRAPEILRERHRMSAGLPTIEWQRRLRTTYLEWLSPQGFFTHLHICLP